MSGPAENSPSLPARLRQRASILRSRLAGPAYADLEPEFVALSEKVEPFTMTTVERRYALWTTVRHVLDHGLEGDVVECGVWRGGSSMLIGHLLAGAGDESRRMWLYDTFEGMSLPTEHDVDPQGRRMSDVWEQHQGRKEDEVFAYGSFEEVERNMLSTGFPADRVTYVKGKVEDTIPGQVPEKIAILRLDTDWYESTRHELEQLWHRLVPGGVLIIDDYGHWAGARKAVDEFFAGREDAPLIMRIDDSGRMAVKTQAVSDPGSR